MKKILIVAFSIFVFPLFVSAADVCSDLELKSMETEAARMDALQDARNNLPPLAPVEDQSEMLRKCGEASCWPYACP